MNADARKALGRVLLECDPKHVDDLVTVVFALRDQEAEIARLHRLLMDERYGVPDHLVPAHLGAEQ